MKSPAPSPSSDPSDPAPAVTSYGPHAASSVSNTLDDAQFSHLPELSYSDISSAAATRRVAHSSGLRAQRQTTLPALLFVATCFSTFWVGACNWEPLRPDYLASWSHILRTIQGNWGNGLQYMIAVLAILLTHEMGHFLQTVRYHIPASYPLCIPVPFNAIGTMGAVIGMDGLKADRRQIFDIGIAGPLAGLVVAVPVLWFGVKQLDLSASASPDELRLYLPLVGQWMLQWSHPQQSWSQEMWVPLSQLNPYFMAGWVGMLITGLNMLPISQLDGGHTIYALFLDRAHGMAKIFVSFAIFYVVANLNEAVLWIPMIVLVLFMGIHHPPTSNDHVDLGPVRWTIGLTSLWIPVLCFPLLGVR